MSSLDVLDLKTEHLTSPIGIQTMDPRFRWRLESPERGRWQSAYQILVATSLEKLRDGIADKWDSGKMLSDNSVEVQYAGRELTSGERAYWKVRVWDEKGLPSTYSMPSSFEMGQIKPDDWRGVWIAAKQGVSAPLFRREFSIDAPVRRARAYISGLGWYELSLNGKKVSDRVLDPASTTYQIDPSTQQKSRVLYATYDVTDALRSGPNAIGVMLGHGWYSSDTPPPGGVVGRVPYGDRPILRLQLNIELANGKQLGVVSDSSWKSAPGPITYNDLAQGENYDTQREQPGWNSPGFDDGTWESVELAKPPNGVLTSQLMPPETVVQTLPVVKIIKPAEPGYVENARVYDFGQRFSGWTRLTVSGPRGATVRLKYVSRINPHDDTPDDRSNSPPGLEARQVDTYILKGSGTEVWEPRFTLHGFRYVEVGTFEDGVSIEKLEGRAVRSAVQSTGSFESSNELLNRIHHNIQWTLMSSFQGIPQDAADRAARVAWLGDIGVVSEDYLYNYDMVGFWEKWLEDIQDNQNAKGGIPAVTPMHWGSVYADVLWPSFQVTYPLLLWNLYEYYGDKAVLARHYDGLRKLIEFLNAAAKDDLIADEPFGDHMEPQANGFSSMSSQHTPQALTASAYYYGNVMLAARISEVLGRSAETHDYEKRAERILKVFNRRFFNAQTNQYGSGSQASNAVPLYLGMVPRQKIAAVVKNLVDDILYKHDTHVSTGILGSNALVQALPRYGAAEVMYRLANQTTYPSLGEQVKKGATTVCESYECHPWKSQNMKMFASLDKFFYRDLAGIQPVSPGFRRVLIQPQPVGDLKSASASLSTVRGTISVDWRRASDTFDLKVSIPAGVQSEIVIPCIGLKHVQVAEGETPIWKSGAYIPGVPGLTGARARTDAIAIQAGSGVYHFALNGLAD